MKIDKSIRSGNEKTDAYIEELESELTSFEASNTRKLIKSIDLLAGKIADDITDVANGVKNSEGKLKEIDNDLVASYIKMVDKTDKITLFSEATVKVMNVEVINAPKSAVEEAKEAELIVKAGENPFEEMMKRVKSKKQ